MNLQNNSSSTKLNSLTHITVPCPDVSNVYEAALMISIKWLFFGTKHGCSILIEEALLQKMSKQSLPESNKKKDWVLTQSAFNTLLKWLDSGVDSGGFHYLEIRRRLILYFDRKNCTCSDELADETLNRVARRLEEEGEIQSDMPVRYCYIVARFVFLESLRKRNLQEVVVDDRLHSTFEFNEDKKETQQRAECLERCMNKLTHAERELIIAYYQGSCRTKIENRRAIATRLKITMNALTIRACRIREKLETYMRQNLSE